MKNTFRIIALLLVICTLIFSACAVVTVKNPPPGQVKKKSAPGQVKKATGSKSAAPYAPGQQNKSKSKKKD